MTSMTTTPDAAELSAARAPAVAGATDSAKSATPQFPDLAGDLEASGPETAD